MKIMKSIRVLAALVLTLTFVTLVPLNTAAANKGKYVSEVYVAYGKDADSAKKTLNDKGFTPVAGNLNEGGKTYVMMGYKTTDDIRDSITDLAVMNMNGGYSVEDYKIFLKKQKTQIAEFLNEFITVIKEYRANLKADKTKATVVRDLLNNYIEDDSGMKMGDLLNGETLQDKVGIIESIEAKNPNKLPDLITILMQGNAQVIKSVEVLLSLATDTADNSWLDRFAALDYDALLEKTEAERPELNTTVKVKQYLDNLYGETATELGKAMVKLREKLKDYEAMSVQLGDATAEKLKETLGSDKKDYNAVLKTKEWISIAAIYEGLKDYEGGAYKKGEMLSLFMKENDPEDEEIFYPMAAALSAGQRNGMPFIGFETLMQFAFTADEGWNRILKTKQDELSSFRDVSVYSEMDRSIYADDGSVALTDKAQREKAVGTAGTNGNGVHNNDALTIITEISWAATTFAILTSSAVVKFAYKDVKKYAYLGEEIGWSKDHLNDVFKMDEKSLNEMASIPMYAEQAGQVQAVRYSVHLAKIFIVTSIFIAVATAVLTVIDILRDKSAEQLPIPKYMVDNYATSDGGSYTLNYKAAECNREEYFGADYKKQKGSNADLLADEGRQWLALYASKNSKAGKGRPITPDFVIQKEKDASKNYEVCIHLFGENGALNVAGNVFRLYSAVDQVKQATKSRNAVYVFCKYDRNVKTYDESAGNMRASAFNSGTFAIWGLGGLAIGAVLGAVVAVLITKNRKKKETA